MELPLVVGITGASGAIYGIRMLEVLRHSGIPAHLIVSRSAVQTLSEEIDMPVDKARALADVVYPNNDLGAAVSSGSFKTRGMIVIPCSIRTVSDVAYGHTDTLVSRAADVTLKERRREAFQLDAALADQRELDDQNARLFDRAHPFEGLTP